MVMPDGSVVTGKTSSRLGAASSLLMNALKAVTGVDMELEVISDDAIEPIQRLKTRRLGSQNPRLHSDETLIALSITSATSEVAARVLEGLKRLRGCDGIVCYNDQIALAVISMLEEKGISVPEDIAVTGYDNSLIGQSSPIGITTIAHPQEKLGEMAAELILEKIRKVPEEESSVKRLISPELIVRESTAGKNLSTETKK